MMDALAQYWRHKLIKSLYLAQQIDFNLLAHITKTSPIDTQFVTRMVVDRLPTHFTTAKYFKSWFPLCTQCHVAETQWYLWKCADFTSLRQNRCKFEQHAPI